MIKNLTNVSIKDYYNKISFLHKFFLNIKFKYNTDILKNEIIKLLNKEPFDKNIILKQLTYLNLSNEEIISQLKLKYINEKSLVGYLNVILLLKKQLELDYSLIKDEMVILINNIKKYREENLYENKNIIDLDINNVKHFLSKIDNPRDKLIFALYTLLPSRRLEYRFLKLNHPNIIENPEYNYIDINDNKIRLIFNEYKTKSTYKRQVFNFDNNLLINIFKEYILKFNININELLFTNSKTNDLMPYYEFAKIISNIFSNIYDKKITLNDIRHSWSNKINEDIPFMSLKELNEISEMMGHSVLENLKYRRIN